MGINNEIDAHQIDLNFTKSLENVDAHNVVLNFGDESSANTAVIDTVLDTAFSFEVVAVFKDNIDVIGQIDTVLDTSFSFEIVAEFAENLCTIDTVLDTEFQFQIDVVFDINHIVGVSYAFDASYQKAVAALSVTAIPWAKPILRVSNEALFYDQGLVLSQQAMAGFDRSNSLAQAVRIEHEKATGLQTDAYLIWQSGDKRFIHQSYLFDETLKLRINRVTDWHEMIRKRRTVTYAHEVAHIFEKHFTFEWDKGLELVTTDDLAWEKAKAIHYRKHPIQPWPKPELPKYEGTGDLNFVCLCNEVDAHNVILNFGVDDCIPAIPNQNWWYILNSLSVTRLDNGAEILVYDGNYRTDRSSWAWSYSLTVPHTEIAKLEPINGQPVILKIMVNGHEHHMLLENRTRSRNFGNITYTLTGRSQTALLDAPYAPLRSFLQENERTSVQLAQAELDRVFSDTVLNWQLIDDLGWIVTNNSLSYSNLAPIAAIKLIAESGGGFIYSEKGSNTLSIKPLYKKTFWDTLTVDDYDRLAPESLVTSQSTDYELYPDYNGITLTNDRTGKQGQIKRTGTAADVLLPPENNPLFDVVSMGAFGKAKLAKAGMVETHTFTMPISTEVGECAPGEVFAFNAQWWGIVESVSVSFSYAKVNQTVKVERVNRE
ncbi:hypothetical protein [Acinetobacter towneri]|uniref:hypothetical protein n=1 Tax=Acinetobacter towneri TaxID=202956 RepID=UPI0034D4E148